MAYSNVYPLLLLFLTSRQIVLLRFPLLLDDLVLHERQTLVLHVLLLSLELPPSCRLFPFFPRLQVLHAFSSLSGGAALVVAVSGSLQLEIPRLGCQDPEPADQPPAATDGKHNKNKQHRTPSQGRSSNASSTALPVYVKMDV